MKVMVKSIFLIFLILSLMNCQNTENTSQESSSSQNLTQNNEESSNQNKLDEPQKPQQEEEVKEVRCLKQAAKGCEDYAFTSECLLGLQSQMECARVKCQRDKFGIKILEHYETCLGKYCGSSNPDVINVNEIFYECLSSNHLIPFIISSFVALISML